MSIKTKTIENVVKILRALNVQYKIITEDGTEYGELVVATQKKKRDRLFPHGHYSTYVYPYLQQLNVGEVAQVPINDYDRIGLSRAVSSCGIRLWGIGSNTTHTTATHIEILRLC